MALFKKGKVRAMAPSGMSRDITGEAATTQESGRFYEPRWFRVWMRQKVYAADSTQDAISDRWRYPVIGPTEQLTASRTEKRSNADFPATDHGISFADSKNFERNSAAFFHGMNSGDITL